MGVFQQEDKATRPCRHIYDRGDIGTQEGATYDPNANVKDTHQYPLQ